MKYGFVVETVANLRSKPARVIGNIRTAAAQLCVAMKHAAKVEVGDLDAPVLVYKQVGGLEIAVQYGRLVVVQLQHAL